MGQKKKKRQKDVARFVFKISRESGLFWRLLSARSWVEDVWLFLTGGGRYRRGDRGSLEFQKT